MAFLLDSSVIAPLSRFSKMKALVLTVLKNGVRFLLFQGKKWFGKFDRRAKLPFGRQMNQSSVPNAHFLSLWLLLIDSWV